MASTAEAEHAERRESSKVEISDDGRISIGRNVDADEKTSSSFSSSTAEGVDENNVTCGKHKTI